MAFVVGRNEIGIRETGRRVTVPDNNIAKLMYYLHCVLTTIDSNDESEIRRFTDYQNWRRLSNDEQKQLVVLCYTLSPDVFEDKVFFQSDALCEDLGNKFYEISQVRQRLVAVQSIVVAGQAKRVNQIMTYKNSWMRTYYLEPMRNEAQRLSENERRRRRGCVIC